MKRVTRWHPDTCDCVLEYEWDDTEPENTRTHTFKAIVNRCLFHASLERYSIYDTVLSENKEKNMVVGKAQELKPDLDLPKVTWWFTGIGSKRVFNIDFAGELTPAQKASIQAKFGKVKIV